MAMHITNIHGVLASGVEMIAQNNMLRIAEELGFKEMGLYCYPVECDTQGELRKRLDGITSAVEPGDMVVFQYPSWNGGEYEKALLNVIRQRADVYVAIFVHDVVPLMCRQARQNYQEIIEIFNMADLVILPSKPMLWFLRGKGLNVKKVLIQSMFDLPFPGELRVPAFRRQLIFSGSPRRDFVSSWHYDLPLRVFGRGEGESRSGNVFFEGWKNTTELLIEYTKGGFGLVWEEAGQAVYYRYNQPYKLPGYLAAGIPVILQKGTTHEQTVKEYHLGFVAGSLDEAVDMAGHVSEDEYRKMTDHVRNFSFLIKGGFFTKKLLIDAVNYMMLG